MIEHLVLMTEGDPYQTIGGGGDSERSDWRVDAGASDLDEALGIGPVERRGKQVGRMVDGRTLVQLPCQICSHLFTSWRRAASPARTF